MHCVQAKDPSLKSQKGNEAQYTLTSLTNNNNQNNDTCLSNAASLASSSMDSKSQSFSLWLRQDTTSRRSAKVSAGPDWAGNGDRGRDDDGGGGLQGGEGARHGFEWRAGRPDCGGSRPWRGMSGAGGGGGRRMACYEIRLEIILIHSINE
jgi:hypothetical protein